MGRNTETERVTDGEERTEYNVSQNRKGLWFAHPVGKPDKPIEGSHSKFMISALQSCADAMDMSYGEYMAYREKYIKPKEKKP